MPHLIGDDDGVGFGVKGTCNRPQHGRGVEGVSQAGDGVFGETSANHAVGVHGVNTGHLGAIAVMGELPKGTTAVMGRNGGGSGVGGDEVDGTGVWGDSTNGSGVVGTSSIAEGVIGEGATFGVLAKSTDGPGVSGVSSSSDGVRATSNSGNGLSARSTDSVAIFAESVKSIGVLGIGHNEPGVAGNSDSSDGVRATSKTGNGLSAFGGGGGGVAIFAQASARRKPAAGMNTTAASFDGNVVVSGDIQILGGGDIRLADLAEDFDISGIEKIEPGSVVVLDDEGSVQQSRAAYDHKVAGVVAGAGNFRSAITLDRDESQGKRIAIALMGKVYCKVDAQYSAIGVGDLLTTSETPGHAMKALDPLKAFGAVIGKALRPLQSGQGTIPVLVTLQ